MFKHKSTIYTDTNTDPDADTEPNTFTDTDADADTDADVDIDADTGTDTRIAPVSLITLLAVLVCDYIPSIDAAILLNNRCVITIESTLTKVCY